MSQPPFAEPPSGPAGTQKESTDHKSNNQLDFEATGEKKVWTFLFIVVPLRNRSNKKYSSMVL